ncbi:metallophosphoesterase [Paenibacillus lignilyticus]|uniref:Metallophosphoesterase n=1 Tax=Paenibacillus lignilyticus TaxID=1172615 RepID=A0ABS5C676_9BACL|nr:metallophosphoesterase [Paenibacillus lignilyticus]MBP3961492.1 metallophosphoesterase [Paenibacillus lignilyticus]
MAVRLTIILSIFLGLQIYIGWHLQLFISAAGGDIPAALFWPVFGIVAFSYLLARLLRRALPGFMAEGLKWIGSYWIAVMQYSVLLLPFADLAAWGLRVGSYSNGDSILITGIAVMAIIGIILAVGSFNAWSPIVRRYEVTIPKAAGDGLPLHIAVASDLHLGSTVRARHLQRLVDQVNALKPDLMLLPGDVLDDAVEPFVKHKYGRKLAEIRAKYGTFAILGNHENYGGGVPVYVNEMREVGIPVLLDEAKLIDNRFYIIGRKDKSDHDRKSAPELVEGLDDSLPSILMDHQPSSIREIAETGVVDLSVHGHTHRGQMAPNHLVTRRIFELDYGYLLKGGLHAFVSSGFGTWGPPIRIGSRSEILSIKVNFASPGNDNK